MHHAQGSSICIGLEHDTDDLTVFNIHIQIPIRFFIGNTCGIVRSTILGDMKSFDIFRRRVDHFGGLEEFRSVTK